jgi:hypothetical protein
MKGTIRTTTSRRQWLMESGSSCTRMARPTSNAGGRRAIEG